MPPVPSIVIEMESRMEYANAAEGAAFEFASVLGLSADDARDYATSVRELAVNGIKHGNKMKARKNLIQKTTLAQRKKIYSPITEGALFLWKYTRQDGDMIGLIRATGSQ